MSKYTLHTSVIKNINTLKSKTLKKAVKDFINYTPVDFGVINNGAFRTAEEQQDLYNKGVSKCDGYIRKSKHQSGLAVDIVPWVNGEYTWDRDTCLYLSGAFRAYCSLNGINVTNGADWNGDGDLKNDSWDVVHFEVAE